MSVLRVIQDFFRSHIEAGEDGVRDQHRLQLATAALLYEMLRADHDEHPEELVALERALKKTFSLDRDETRQLAKLAKREVAESVSLYQFTGLINRHFSPQEKVRVVEMLWQVAFADDRLDRYEEALVRKIADLIHVPHRDFIRARHRVEKQGDKKGSR
ncbi:MAG: TerB family tellurite resistance protein [Thiogranum sp.]|nr:TerB family tellurite resistance protein [Thiogranum sp.]